MAFLSQVPLDKLIRLKGEQSSNLGTILGTRDYHKCDHCLGDSLGILCKLDNTVVNQLLWYTPWSRWSMTPIISPVLHMLKLPLPDRPTWAEGWVSRVLRWLFCPSHCYRWPRAGKKELQEAAPISVPNLHASVGSRIPTWLGLFLLFFLWCLVRFFPPVWRVGAELYSLSLLSKTNWS